jgi:riboflavin synthase
MFTGIIEETGTIQEVRSLPDAAQFRIRGPLVLSDASAGDSIAVNGICLTVTDVRDDAFTCDVMAETLARTALRDYRTGDRVNLERALSAHGRLGGHIVQGHVDAVGTVREIETSENWRIISIDVPPDLRRYIVEKGSICVDGVSLTVAHCTDTGFAVSCIPTTLDLTTLNALEPGSVVNLEVDVIAKYVESLLVGYRS